MKIIYKLNKNHIEDLYNLYEKEWWTTGRSMQEIEQCLKGSDIVIGFVDTDDVLQGFVRVLTDNIFKAIIFDLIVSKTYRNRGLGDKIMDLILDHQALQSIKHIELYCLPEMIDYYKRFGFTQELGTLTFMRKEKQ